MQLLGPLRALNLTPLAFWFEGVVQIEQTDFEKVDFHWLPETLDVLTASSRCSESNLRTASLEMKPRKSLV